MPETRLKDRWWRLNNLYYIIDEHGNKIKFQPKNREVQTYLYDNLWYLNEILKSRQHGVTTFFCIFFLDACLFKGNTRAGIIAHNREDAEAFFKDKVKFAYDNIEIEAIKEVREAQSDSSRELLFSNNSAIRVGTSLRSATLQYLLISEYGKICAKFPDKAKEIRTGALNTVHKGQFIAIESTAEGREGHYYELDKMARNLQVSGKELTVMDYRHFFFPWWMKPEYRLDHELVIVPSEMMEYFRMLKSEHGIKVDVDQRAWYVKKYETQQDEMKREFPSTPEEAFEAALIGAYYSKQMVKVRKDGRLCEIPYDPNYLVYTAWDLGINDEMAIWFFQLIGPWVNIIDYYENSDEGMVFYKDVLDEKEYKYGTPFAPHDIKKRDLISGRTRIARAKDIGLDFEMINRAQDVVEDINEVRRIFFKFRFDESRCDGGLKSVEAYRKEWDEDHACFRKRPLHNWATHGADALRTLSHAVANIQGMNNPEDEIVVKRGPMAAQAGGWMVT